MQSKATPSESSAFNELERYRLLVDSITDYAIYMLDPTGVVSSWNRGAQRFKGYTADEIVGRHFGVFYTPADRAEGVPARVLREAAELGRFECEGWRVRKDGTHFWAHVVIDPVLAPSGELLGFAKITRDLTERRAALQALRESEEQFRLLVQGVTDYAIFMLTPDGHVRSWNAGARRIKGYLADEIVGQHFSKFYAPEDQAAGRPEAALRTAASERRFEADGWRVRKDGSRFWANVIIDAIHADDGRLLGFAKVTRDVSERRAAQDALDKAREALFQAQKMEAVGQVTGGVAHDFNNLLMAVLGSLELLQKYLPAEPRLVRLADNAIQGARRGAALTRRMLAFARQQELKREAVMIPPLVRGMLDLIERSIGRNVTVRTDLCEDLPPVATDPNQLEATLLNLAVNARDAMPDGGVLTISANAETVDGEDWNSRLAPGRYVRLWVADTGVGMDAETVSRSTEPFFTTKEVGKGTGLGLSMVKGLVEQSGGQLRIQSAVGKGTVIELWFPTASHTLTCATEEQRVIAQRRSSPQTVLAVDDDQLVLRNMTFLLEDLGHTVLQAASGVEALRILEGGAHVDLIITDHLMPQMTGLQVIQAVRTRWPHLPVILATGFAQLPSSATGFMRLAKPFTRADLALALATAASGSANE